MDQTRRTPTPQHAGSATGAPLRFMRSNGNRKLRLTSLMAAAALGVTAVFVSCSTGGRTVEAPGRIEGAFYAGNKSCYECHANYSRSFASSPHARLHFDPLKSTGETGCESCHGPASKHIAAGGGRGKFILNPGKDPQPCLACHVQTHAEFRLPRHHPVLEGRMNCAQCHDPHGRDIMKPAGFGPGMARRNESCGECHREQTQPHVFEHRALWEGCTSCHHPHGSVNSKLLTQRDLNLCLKCHAQNPGGAGQFAIGKIDHTSFVRQGACWSAGCHPSIHGSNVSPHFHY